MFELNTYLQTLHDLHGSDECVLVGLGLELPKLLLGMDFQKIVAAEADLREIEKVSKVYDFSERFFITDSLIAKDDTDAKFQIASNPSANTFTDIEDFREIYPNIALKQTLEKPSISLDTFMSNNNLKNAKWLILNTLNSKTILEQNDLNKFNVVVCKIKKSELSEVQTKLEEDDFKHLRCFEKQNPKILWSIFVKDTKKLTTQKEQELQEILKQTTDEKEQTVKQLQEEQIKVKEVTENLTKSKEELEALKKLTAKKEQELQERLKQTTDEKEQTAKQLQEQQTKVKEVTENFTKSREELEALKKLTAKKEQELQERLKQTTDEKEQTAKQLQEQQTKVKEVTENFTKSKEELEALKKLTTQKEQELQERLKQTTDEKEQTAKQLQEEQTKVKELTENFTKSKEELETLKKLTAQKEQELQERVKQVSKDKDKIIEDLLLSKKRIIPKSYLSTIDKNKKIDFISSYCMMKDDILDAIDIYVLGDFLAENEKFELCCSFAIKIAKSGDKHQGISFVNNARYFLDKENNQEQYKKLIELASSLNSIALAVDLEMEFNAKYGQFSVETNKKIFDEYKKIRSASLKKQAHGHDLLIDYIEKNVNDNDQSGKILVEIGTTRENIPGQGSTMQLAKLCKKKNIKFITVDMDPHNGRWAKFVATRLNYPIECITKKGEDYLRKDIDSFDFIFLDAYDFDHGKHSELRQSRYRQNLGSRIDEEACHLMHLECAKSVVKKLKKDGVVCVDDTWLNEDENWTAKGTLAVPYLVDNKFKIIEAHNNALLLKNIDKPKEII